MKKNPFQRIAKVTLAAVAATSMLVVSANAQQKAKLKIDKPEFDELTSPDFSGSIESKRWKAKDWLEVELKFKVEAIHPKGDGFVDKLTVKWYVAVLDPEAAAKGKKKYLLLEKEVNHVNIEVDEDMYVSCYISPSSVKRLSGGSDRANKNLISHVGGEILLNGTIVGNFTSKGKEGWWNSTNLSRSTRIPLLNKNETPFKFLWWDRYAEISEEK